MPHNSILVAAAFNLAALSVVVPDFQAQASQDAAPASSVRVKRVRLGTGVELQVAESGPADGEPVLFLHGFTDSWLSYTPVLDRLPAHLRAIVPSQRGHGDSERPACCYRVADFARDAIALLDTLGLERATVVGHSMGSFIAQRIATYHPARVNRLVLIGSGRTIRTRPVMEFNDAVQKLTDPIAPAFVREFQASSAFKPLPPAFLDSAVRESEKLPARVWRDTLAALLAPDALDQPHRIQAATLIVWGDKDAFWSRPEQDALVRAIRGARLITYPDIGHAPHWEQPDRFVADLQEFLSARVAAATAPERRNHEAHAHSKTREPGLMPLLPGLGDWQHEITTTSAEAQRYFDQGLRLTYAFNHDEAVRSFERAAQLDAQCAMCYWGLAYALGPNINLPMDAQAESRASAAVSTAVRLKGRTTPLEDALIDAMALRYGEPAGAARAERDAAYATAMREVARRYPSDTDAQVLFADAMLNLRPWNQWTRDGRPQHGTEELIVVLEHALEQKPNHAGGCHLYIHAVEASETPERALPCAERLPRLMPGAGHVVHMPAHVYLRVGRYEDAARANIAAVDADNRYFAERKARPGIYPTFYAPHNLHFLWATYLLSGQRAKAVEASRTLVERVAIEDARANAALEGFLPAAILTHARFADWGAVLAEPAPPSDLQYVTGMWHYARGLAFSARGDVRSARVELERVRAIAAQVKAELIIILNPAPALLKLAAEVLAGDIAAKQKRFDESIARFRTAGRLEDALTYDEPPPWYHPTRNMLGEALLEAGRTAEAEAAFREDLRLVRETGWSLSGLERALRAQGRGAEAADVARRFEDAWKNADAPAHPVSNGQYGTKRPGGTR